MPNEPNDFPLDYSQAADCERAANSGRNCAVAWSPPPALPT